MKNELNSRQWKLYEYLKKRGNVWTSQWYLASVIPEYGYDNTTQDTRLFHDSKIRLQMTKDIRTINDSGVIQKVIMTGAKGVKLATREEFEAYIKSEFSAVFRKLKRVRTKAKKAGLDKQMKIVFNTERDTIEAFIDSERLEK